MPQIAAAGERLVQYLVGRGHFEYGTLLSPEGK